MPAWPISSSAIRFVSYKKRDRDWAFWLAAELKALGHTPHIHEWEIKGGDDIYAWMEAHHDTAPALSAAFVGIRVYAELELRWLVRPPGSQHARRSAAHPLGRSHPPVGFAGTGCRGV
jgi:hypothetical protein